MQMSSDNKPSINPAPDGPLLVNGVIKVVNKNGEMERKEKMALCRCGASSNKPYCDGTHKSIGFSSTKLDGRLDDKRDNYAGQSITIHDNRSVCAHAGICTDGLASVFRYKQEPWIDPNGASADEIIAAVKKCPSGALSYTVNDAERIETSADATIFIAPNGPYALSGDCELVDSAQGTGAAKKKVTLCRCGASKNKPFCDGSHWSVEFVDDNN
jgi:CDGSH-type Zn-finger protein